jgi:hypothetical protein
MLKCPYLVRCAMSKCRDANKSSMPGLLDLQEYCDDSGNFRGCLLFQRLAGGIKMMPARKYLHRVM